MVDLPMAIFMTLFISFYMITWVIFSYVYWLNAKIRTRVKIFQFLLLFFCLNILLTPEKEVRGTYLQPR